MVNAGLILGKGPILSVTPEEGWEEGREEGVVSTTASPKPSTTRISFLVVGRGGGGGGAAAAAAADEEGAGGCKV